MLNLDQILCCLRWPLAHFLLVNIRHIRGNVVLCFFLLLLLRNVTIMYLNYCVLKFQSLVQQ